MTRFYYTQFKQTVIANKAFLFYVYYYVTAYIPTLRSI